MPLPHPMSGESQDDWMERCVSDDQMVSEFPDNDQRLAVCSDIWERKKMPTILEAIRSRATKQTEFGYGIMTADRYVKNMQDAVGLPLCYDQASTRRMSFNDAMTKAANTLVYSNPEMVVLEKAAPDQVRLEGVELPKNTLMVFKHVLTTPRKDRDGDVLRTEGAIVDPRMLLLWQHTHTLPIGKMLAVAEHNSKRLVLISAIVDINPLAHDAAIMVDNDMARFSHGFRALEFQQLKEVEGETTGGEGFDIRKFEIIEESIVSVPSNADAEVIDRFVSLVDNGKLCSPLLKEYGKSLRREMPVIVAGFTLKGNGDGHEEKAADRAEGRTSEKASDLPNQDEREDGQEAAQLPEVKQVQVGRVKAFDPELEHLEASRLEYEWTSRWLDCQVKEMEVISTFVPRYRMGSFLTGLKHQKANSTVRDVRNLTREGREEPPSYEVIQLNSRLSDTFLSEGIEFLQAPTGEKYCVKIKSTYGGVQVVTYAKLGSAIATTMIDDSWKFAQENNFLKGEAFCLSGEFLSRKAMEWDDVFLEDVNKKALQRTVRLINEQKAGMPNRGAIVMGPPGCGKTMTGRVILNKAEATFIWVAAKDFWKMGAVEGLCAAFELAAELAPAVIFMEDVDNWISSYAVDVIKTEMDGIGKGSGVVTVLTTNYPDRFPDALIDRPGRFHDVLLFDLPSDKVRREMLTKWTDGVVAESQIDALVKRTSGYSGAHIYELVYFAKTLQTEEEGLSLDMALTKAVEKIDSQRALIDANQLAGSNFRKSSGLPEKVKQYLSGLKPMPKSTIVETTKAGRVLSAANLKMIQDCIDDLKACIDTDKDMARGTQAICERVVSKLEKVASYAATESDDSEDKPAKPEKSANVSVKEAMGIFLAEASDSDRREMVLFLSTLEHLHTQEKMAAEYEALVGQ